MTSITIPSSAADAYLEDDAVIIITDPPNLPLAEWKTWADGELPFPVAEVCPITEDGRTLCRIVIGDIDTNGGDLPKEFRIMPPKSDFASVSITLGESTSDRTYAPSSVTMTGSLPQSTKQGVELRRCSCPARIWSETHSKVKAYAATHGLEIAAVIGKAVDLLTSGRSKA